MNLIERLEGYDKAKLIVDNQINSEFQTEFFDINGNYYANDFGDLVIYRNNQWVDFDSKDPEFELFSITDLEAEVMQYRRANNIFEVGDKVVIRKADGHPELFTYESISKSGNMHFFESPFNYGHLDLCKVRHATGAEIEAGKRLEVV